MREICTIGHSTHTFEHFLEMLRSFEITHLVDVRNFPGSLRFPQFGKENLEKQLKENGIIYTHLKDLGGRRKPKPDSRNTNWRNEAFRGYADYMESEQFINAVNKLQELATTERVAYMCAEAVWWSCHRALISDYLKWKGWKVNHIMGIGKQQEHPYTKAAAIAGDQLVYGGTLF